MVKKIIPLCLLISTALLVTLSSVFVTDTGAYKSGSDQTHRWIFEQANKILGNDGHPYVHIATFLNSSDPGNPGDTYLETLIRGSDDGDSLYEAREHYMDPTDHDGLWVVLQYKSAGKLCQEYFNDAVNAWQTGDKSDAMYKLGMAAHLVQDVCVPHHAFPKFLEFPSSHASYEDWVEDNMADYAVDSGGTYSFSSFPDYEHYEANVEYQDHYVWDSAFAWVDYNAHESIKHFARVNYKLFDGYVTDDYDVKTVHNLPNNLVTWWNITEYGVTKMRLLFKKIDMETGDYVRIYDADDILQISYTGYKLEELTPEVTGNTIKIKIETDSSTQSWGYETEELEYYDVGDDLHAATDVLLKRAQRTTAGFIHFFFQKVGVDLWLENKNGKDSQDIWADKNDGTIIYINARIHNKGPAHCPAGSEVKFYYSHNVPDWQYIGNTTLDSVSNGSATYAGISTELETPVCVKVEIKTTSAAYERDPTNNEAFENFHSDSTPVGETKSIVFGLKNIESQNVYIVLTVDPASDIPLDWNVNLDSQEFWLASQESKSVELNVTGPSVAVATIIIKATKDAAEWTYWEFEIHTTVGVGGLAIPVDKLGLLAPYVAVAIVSIAVTIGAAYARKRWLGKAVVSRS